MVRQSNIYMFILTKTNQINTNVPLSKCKCKYSKTGAGKSTILYRHLAKHLYSSTDSMRIPPTITYNREQIKPKRRIKATTKQIPEQPPISTPNSHKRHFSANNISISVGNLSKSKSYNPRPTNHKHKHKRRKHPIPVPTSKPPGQPRLQTHNSHPVPSLHSKKKQTKTKKQKYRNRMPINPVLPPLIDTTLQIQMPPLQMQTPQIQPHLPPLPKVPIILKQSRSTGHYRSQSQKVPDVRCYLKNAHSHKTHHAQSRSQDLDLDMDILSPVPEPDNDGLSLPQKPLPSDDVILNVYDYGGNASTRELWTTYKQNVPQLRKNNQIDFIILVIDSTDYDRLNDENSDCIQNAMKDLLNDTSNDKIPMIIFANKQDLVNALSIDIIEYRLGLKRVEVYELVGIMKESRREFDDKYCGDLSLPWKVSTEIVGFLPDEDTYWMMSKRDWMIFGSIAIKEGDKGIKNGLKWLYDEYDQQFKIKNKGGIKRKKSFTKRLRFTM